MRNRTFGHFLCKICRSNNLRVSIVDPPQDKINVEDFNNWLLFPCCLHLLITNAHRRRFRPLFFKFLKSFIHLRSATSFICICSDILLSLILLLNVTFDFSFFTVCNSFGAILTFVSSFCSLFGAVKEGDDADEDVVAYCNFTNATRHSFHRKEYVFLSLRG